ncbi:hypothetical protein VSU19_19495 [Verrucomicrobiales bacterium BCK34]|nr:hypothetical protein [Verrucomicrobiales bacterium BCK34]
MKKIIVLYLLLGGISQFFILLVLNGFCQLQIDFWEWRDPDTPLDASVLNSVVFLKCGMIIPVFLGLTGVAYLANRISGPGFAIHTLGISMFLVASLAVVSVGMVFKPMVMPIMTSMPFEESPVE